MDNLEVVMSYLLEKEELRLTSALVWVEVELSWGWAWQQYDLPKNKSCDYEPTLNTEFSSLTPPLPRVHPTVMGVRIVDNKDTINDISDDTQDAIKDITDQDVDRLEKCKFYSIFWKSKIENVLKTKRLSNPPGRKLN